MNTFVTVLTYSEKTDYEFKKKDGCLTIENIEADTGRYCNHQSLNGLKWIGLIMSMITYNEHSTKLSASSVHWELKFASAYYKNSTFCCITLRNVSTQN